MTVRKFLALLLAAAAVVTGCSSRYRLNLYSVSEEGKNKVKVEKTEYLKNRKLADPFAEDKVVMGSGNCVIVTTGTRGPKLKTDQTRTLVFQYDEYLRTKIYLQLPLVLQKGEIDFKKNSFVQMMGRYEQPPEDKIFLPDSGSVVIDSIADKRVFITFDGHYVNKQGIPLTYQGKFKAKIAE